MCAHILPSTPADTAHVGIAPLWEFAQSTVAQPRSHASGYHAPHVLDSMTHAVCISNAPPSTTNRGCFLAPPLPSLPECIATSQSPHHSPSPRLDMRLGGGAVGESLGARVSMGCSGAARSPDTMVPNLPCCCSAKSALSKHFRPLLCRSKPRSQRQVPSLDKDDPLTTPRLFCNASMYPLTVQLCLWTAAQQSAGALQVGEQTARCTLASRRGDNFGRIPYFATRAASCSWSTCRAGGFAAAISSQTCSIANRLPLQGCYHNAAR